MNALLTAHIIDSLFTREYNDNIINNNIYTQVENGF
jgi:hypothetical protein